MDERKKPFKYAALAALLVVAFSFLTAGLSTPAPTPKEEHRRYSPWAKDFLVWSA